MSGSLNAARSSVDGNYASVNEQSGIKAGDGGFQINVKGNTDLKGAKIASTDKAVRPPTQTAPAYKAASAAAPRSIPSPC